jgi:cell division cycle 14
MNVLGPFIPFASPVDKLWVLEELAKREPTRANLTALAAEQATQRNTPKSRFPNRAFRCIMKVFKEESVGVVVRLNNDL